MAAGKEKNFVYRNPGKSWSRIIFWWARALITAGLAWYLISQIWREIDHISVQLVNPSLLVLVFIAAIIAILLSVRVWHLMLPVDDQSGYLSLLAHYLLGLFLNNFLPGGIGGDVVRVGALVHDGQRIDSAANSVLMARLLGLWAIVLLACSTAPFYALVTSWQVALPFIIFALGALVFALLGSGILFGAPMTFVVNHLPKSWQTWHCQLQGYREKTNLLLSALGLSFIIQILAVTINAFMARALGISISFGMLLITIPLINLVVLLPISIGGFGVREGTYYYLLGFFGVSAANAVLLSLAVYILLMLVAAVGAGATQFLIPRIGNGR